MFQIIGYVPFFVSHNMPHFKNLLLKTVDQLRLGLKFVRANCPNIKKQRSLKQKTLVNVYFLKANFGQILTLATILCVDLKFEMGFCVARD